ncbi:hypothetical protein [Methylophaga thiooxydans]|uniref:hypothetical protein n=1 Tax=Methylophaga thiooxydans TaxID=392484 RepID=UPI0023550573|nr:hypothetical protein [Methylophaga thiooxydans]
MRHFKKSKVIMIGLFSGLMLALTANPAKAADIRIGIGFDLGHHSHHDYYSRHHHAPVITYRHYDYHDRYYHKKQWKHHKKHRTHYDGHDRHYKKRAHYNNHRGYDRRSHNRHDRRSGDRRYYRH